MSGAATDYHSGLWNGVTVWGGEPPTPPVHIGRPGVGHRLVRLT